MDRTGSGSTRFAHHGEVRLAYQDLGPAAGDPLLMIMGLGASRNWWPQGLIRCLQDHGFRPAVFDLRDTGASTHMTQASSSGPFRAMLRGTSAAYRPVQQPRIRATTGRTAAERAIGVS